MKLQDVLKTKKEVEADGYTIVNNIIETVDVRVIGHFGNITCLSIFCKDIVPVCNLNNLQNLGFLIRSLFDLLDMTDEDGRYLSDAKDIPCRLIFTRGAEWGSKCVGFGNFMKDKFVYTGDFVKINEV